MRPHPASMLTAFFALALAAGPARADEEVFRFEQTLINVGAVSDEQPVMQVFPFVNTTNRTVKVTLGYCHFCAPPILDKTVLKPGEHASLIIELDTSGRRGPVQASATISEGERRGTEVTVEIKAEVCPRVWVEPNAMFPHIVRGQGGGGASSSFTVIGRTKDFKVERVESDAPIAGFDLAPPQEIQDCGSKAWSQQVTVRFPANAELGRYTNRLRVITNDDRAGAKDIPVDGTVVGRINVASGTIGARLQPGEAFSRTFELVAEDTPLLVQSLDVVKRDGAESIALDMTPTINPSRVRVTISGVAPLRPRQAVDIQLEILATTLASSDVESVKVPVTLVVSPPPPQSTP